jgi:hypothetical protein
VLLGNRRNGRLGGPLDDAPLVAQSVDTSTMAARLARQRRTASFSARAWCTALWPCSALPR